MSSDLSSRLLAAAEQLEAAAAELRRAADRGGCGETIVALVTAARYAGTATDGMHAALDETGAGKLTVGNGRPSRHLH
jgi:hypothetical protein